MVRNVGRSRGCQTCITRRLKCGEETPQCNQCISAGWDCPGPVKGAIFIDMSKKVRRKMNRSDAEKARKAHSQHDSSRPQGSARKTGYGNHQSLVLAASTLPTSYQPHRGEIFQNLYIDHFISLQDTSIIAWITELPKIAHAPSSQSELYGIRAATMASYARLSGNKDIEREASKWYLRGLDAQRKSLSSATNHTSCSQGAVGAALMFSCFESIICTTPMGWMQHYEAAIKMFEIAGPEKCQTGLIHMYFRSIRLPAFTISLTFDQPCSLASDLWCTVPFKQNPKTPFDRLIDLLLQLPSCLPYRNEMRSVQYENPTRFEILREYVGNAAKDLVNRLDDFWQEYKNQVDPDYAQRMRTISSRLPVDAEQETICTHPFKSPPDAYLTSIFDVGKVIALRILGAASSVPNLYDQAIIMHGASILASAAYCAAQGLFNGVSFSMVIPLKIICLLSPSDDQKALAQSTLVKWGSERGLADICEVAAPSYLDRGHG